MFGAALKTRGMHIISLPAFRDNYIWLVHDGRHAAAVDPGDARPVEEFLAAQGLVLTAILITHHHPDHVGGLPDLLVRWKVPVFGPAAEHISGVDHPVSEGDVVELQEIGLSLAVLDVPGHTAGHVAYHASMPAPGALFCGDTMFSAGCGRLFEGTAAQMAASLAKFAALPDSTRVYCTHEYTLSNLAFARAAEPANAVRDDYAQRCEALRAAGHPTLPSTIALEKAVNPFLRCNEDSVIDALAAHTGTRPTDAIASLAALRAWKDVF